MSGQNSELHLFGLRRQALKEKISMPDVFTDTSYVKVFDYDISTSQVRGKHDTVTN